MEICENFNAEFAGKFVKFALCKVLHLFCNGLNIFSNTLNLFCNGLNLFSNTLNLFCKVLNLFSKVLQKRLKVLNPFSKTLNLFCKTLQKRFKALHPLFKALQKSVESVLRLPGDLFLLQSFAGGNRKLSGAWQNFDSFGNLWIVFNQNLICRNISESRRCQIKPYSQFDKCFFAFDFVL